MINGVLQLNGHPSADMDLALSREVNGRVKEICLYTVSRTGFDL